MSTRYIVAIDLGSSFIKGAVAQKDEQGNIKLLAIEKEPSAGVRNGVVYNSSEAAGKVKNIILKLQNHTHIKEIGKVYIGLAGHTIKTISNTIPFRYPFERELSEEDLSNFFNKNDELSTEDTQVYEIFQQEFLIDGELVVSPLGCTAKEGEAQYKIIAGKPQIKERIGYTLERVPLDIAGLFTAPVTTGEVLLSEADKELGCAVIDFGGETTSVSVYIDHILRHVAVIPFGGKTITKDITNLKVTTANAEKLKTEYGCALVSMENPGKEIKISATASQPEEIVVSSKNLAQIIEARMDEITNFVCLELDKSGYYDSLRNGLIITGGGSQLKGLAELLKLKSGFNIRLGGSFNKLLNSGIDKNYLTPDNTHLIGLLYFGNEDCITSEPKELKEVKVPTTSKRNFLARIGTRIGDTLSQNLFEDRP